MATQSGTFIQQEPAQMILRADAVPGELPLEIGKKEGSPAWWSIVHFIFVAALLTWPLTLLLMDGIRASLPIFVGCYGAAFSMTQIPEWRWHLLSFTLIALGVFLVYFTIIHQP